MFVPTDAAPISNHLPAGEKIDFLGADGYHKINGPFCSCFARNALNQGHLDYIWRRIREDQAPDQNLILIGREPKNRVLLLLPYC